jgi:hypothetical protein
LVRADLNVVTRGELGRLVEARPDLLARLLQAEGFVVEAPDGDLGTVEAFHPGARPGTPGFLMVRGGWLGRRRMMVSAVDISAVLTSQRRIRVRSTGMKIKT